ncbi:MAG TPA: hypothetical protein VHE54_18240 [Puia sp.]|nr:hypothetical protein [Puia sp.]
MNNSSNKSGCEPDLRSLLKNQHKVVYSICRFFAHNYQEHQRLFTNIIAAASQNIRSRRDHSDDKQTLLLRACINMAALHSISLEMAPSHDRTIQFKSTDYHHSMTKFRESMGEISDLEKFRLFMQVENVAPGDMSGLTGLDARNLYAGRRKERETTQGKNLIPYLKATLSWS